MIEAVSELMREAVAAVIIEGDEFSSYFLDKIRTDFQHARREITQAMLKRASRVDFSGTSIPVVQAEDLIELKVQAYHHNHRRLQDRIDIQKLIEANWGKLDMPRVQSYYALFGLEKDLDDILRLVSNNHE